MNRPSRVSALAFLLTLWLGAAPVWSQPTQLGETVSLRSEILDELRTVYVSLPASYSQSERSYPVLYLMDGNWHFPVVASQVRYLSECGASDIIAPELIVVGIENVDRDKDFTPTHVPEYEGVGHNQSLPLAYYRAIRALYSDWLAPDEVIEAGRGRIDQYYKELSNQYGYAVPLPEPVLQSLGVGHLQAERLEEARAVFEELTKLYPESSFGHYLLGRAWQKSGDPAAAREEYLRAIQIESNQQPPDGLDLRYYRSRLAEVEALFSEPTTEMGSKSEH